MRRVGLLVVLGAAIGPASAAAATITVNTGADNPASPGECSGVPADCSLRQAIDKAAAGDTVVIPASVPTVALASFITLSKNVTIAGSGPTKNKIDGQLSSSLFGIGTGVTATISGLELTRAIGADGAAVGAIGGGNITLSNDVFADNVSGGSNTAGFGVVDISGSATVSLTVNACSFLDNNVGGGGSSGPGFGVIDFGSGGPNSELSITNSKFTDNVIGGSGGTGFGTVEYDVNVNSSADAFTVRNSVFSGNHDGAGAGTLGFGGGIDATAGGGTVSITGSRFDSNVLGGDGGSGSNSGVGFGGGVDVVLGGSASLSLTDSVFTGNRLGGKGADGSNSGGGFGGGATITFGTGTSATISGNTITGQTVGGDGGSGPNSGTAFGVGLDLETEAGSGAVVVQNNTITGNVGGGTAGTGSNSGGGFGGGVLLGFGAATLVNDTIDANRLGAGGAGGGIEGQGATQPNVTLKNTIIAGNAPSDCGSVFTSLGHNLSTTPASQCGLTAAGDLIGDPHLGPLRDNGGPTQTQALLGGPAVNGGTNAGCPGTDQRGVARPQQNTCDIGAYEVAPPSARIAAISALKPTSATLHATVINPDLQPGTALFQYGTSTKFGSSTHPQTIAAATTQQVTASLTKLKPHTRYHVRLVVTNPDGSFSTGTLLSFMTPAAKLTNLKIHPAKLAAGKTATISYTDNAPGTVTFTVLSSKGKKLGSFKHKGKLGKNKFGFKPKLHGQALPAGSYRLRASAGPGSKPVTIRFRVS